MSTRLRPLALSYCLSISLYHTHMHTHTHRYTAAVEQLVALLTHSVPGGEEAKGMREKIKWGRRRRCDWKESLCSRRWRTSKHFLFNWPACTQSLPQLPKHTRAHMHVHTFAQTALFGTNLFGQTATSDAGMSLIPQCIQQKNQQDIVSGFKTHTHTHIMHIYQTFVHMLSCKPRVHEVECFQS